MPRPSDEDHAAAAARHIYEKEASAIEARLAPLRSQGVHDEASLRDHVLAVMQARDSQGFRGAHGRESYANDRMNTIVHGWESDPARNTVYHNDARDRDGGPSATDRLKVMAEREHEQYRHAACQIRTGGSDALEPDRRSESAQAGAARSSGSDERGQLRQTNDGKAVTMASDETPTDAFNKAAARAPEQPDADADKGKTSGGAGAGGDTQQGVQAGPTPGGGGGRRTKADDYPEWAGADDKPSTEDQTKSLDPNPQTEPKPKGPRP